MSNKLTQHVQAHTRPTMFGINMCHYNKCECKRSESHIHALPPHHTHTQKTGHTLTGVHNSVAQSMCMECACSAGRRSSMQSFLLGLPSLTMIGCDVIGDSDWLGPLRALIGAKQRAAVSGAKILPVPFIALQWTLGNECNLIMLPINPCWDLAF